MATTKLNCENLPSDELILEWFERIPNPAWRFVYGVMATYGLRNHEVFFCDYSSLAQGDPEAPIEVLPTTKTGAHDVWPFLPEWVERFQLRQGAAAPHPDRSDPHHAATHWPTGNRPVPSLRGALFALRSAPCLGSAHHL
jgi:hypothetical protein